MNKVKKIDQVIKKATTNFLQPLNGQIYINIMIFYQDLLVYFYIAFCAGYLLLIIKNEH